MSFDIEPDAPIHGECAAEINRLEKVVAGKDARINVLETYIKDDSASLESAKDKKLTDRDAMIEKLETALKYYSDEKNWYDTNEGKKGMPHIRMVIGSLDTEGTNWLGGRTARLTLAELNEWKKTK